MTIPEQYKYAVIPHVMIDGAAEAIKFYVAAFGASEYFRLEGDDGRIVHAEISIRGSALMLGDADAPFSPPSAIGASVALHVYVPDVDALTAQAVAASAELLRPPTTCPTVPGSRCSATRSVTSGFPDPVQPAQAFH